MKQFTNPRNGQTVDVEGMDIPDLWHLAMEHEGRAREAILETWHAAHAMRAYLLTLPEITS